MHTIPVWFLSFYFVFLAIIGEEKEKRLIPAILLGLPVGIVLIFYLVSMHFTF